MKVIRAGALGFCMGVRRAVEMALKESGEKDKRVFTLGPLIHNPGVLEDFFQRGITILKEEDISTLSQDSTVIIRAHGVSPAVEKKLVERGVCILDATCPHVKVSQNRAMELSNNGFYIFLAGEEKHAEITGIRGYIKGGCCVVADSEGAETAAVALASYNPEAKTALIAQTTMNREEFRIIGEAIRGHFPDLKIIDTICGATRERQDALRKLRFDVDAFIIAGGRESANTRRLLSIAESCGKKAWLVEHADELPSEVFSFSVIGLAAGASAPDSVINAIEEKLLSV